MPEIKLKFLPQKNCDITNGIYCIVCWKCNKLYVRETGLSFRKRINIHRLDVRLRRTQQLLHTSTPGAAGRPI